MFSMLSLRRKKIKKHSKAIKSLKSLYRLKSLKSLRLPPSKFRNRNFRSQEFSSGLSKKQLMHIKLEFEKIAHYKPNKEYPVIRLKQAASPKSNNTRRDSRREVENKGGVNSPRVRFMKGDFERFLDVPRSMGKI
jgi:hypothetical protein